MHLLLAARKAAGNRKSYARCTIYASRSRYNNHRVVIIPPDFNASFARRPLCGRQPQKLCTLYHLRFAFTVQQPQGGYYTTGFQRIFCSPPAKRPATAKAMHVVPFTLRVHGTTTTGWLLYHRISMHLLLAARKAAGNRKSYARCTIYASRSRYNNHRVVIIPPDFNASFARRPQSGRQPQKLCTLYHLRFAFTVQQPQGGYYTTGFQCIFCSPPAKRAATAKAMHVVPFTLRVHGTTTTGWLLYHRISTHLLLAARKAAGNRKSYARCTIYASRSRYNNHRVVIIPPDFNASFARRPQSGRQPQKLCTLYHLRFAFTVQQPQGGYYTTGFQRIFCSLRAKRNLCTSHRRPRRLGNAAG